MLRSSAACLCALATVLVTGIAGADPTPAPDSDPRIEIGRRLFEDGVLPDGGALRALRPEGIGLEGREAACARCHRRSGMGSFEGTVFVPPILGDLLFRDAHFDESYRDAARFEGSYLDPRFHFRPDAWRRAMTRPAYDAASLARALREGVDPAGKPLVAPMPRFDLDDAQVDAVVAYLRSLSAQATPGVEPGVLHLATVIAPDAPPGREAAVVGVLKAWIASSGAVGEGWRLHVWRLAGAPETWASQLQEQYRRRPVFALLSGAGGAEWGPVHRFCEDNRIPCLLPSLDVAPVGEGGYYTLYFSPGVTLEARVLAGYWRSADAPRPRRLIQIHAGAAGARAAAALVSDLGHDGPEVIDRRYRVTAPLAALNGLGDDDALVLWLTPDAIAPLVAAHPEGVAATRVYLSALLAPPDAVALPPAWKRQVRYLSLFDDLGVQAEIARLRLLNWLDAAGLPRGGDVRAKADAFAACYLMYRALVELRAEEIWRPAVALGREHLLEEFEGVISKNNDGTGVVDPHSHVALYGRMSLAADQRVAVRGGSLLRFADPGSARLVADSERIVP